MGNSTAHSLGWFAAGSLPQSEGGIVRDPAPHEHAGEKIWKFVEDSGREWKGLVTSPIIGTDGNVEFLAWIG